ncbi:MAG: antitoxin VapB family protein [Methanophagales archaeon]|nr:antitoxin VapB family protein [Methanophagales archaeon]
MAHTTLTISENAYKALSKLKGEGESINEVTERLTKRLDLAEFVELTDFPEELADKIEEVYKGRNIEEVYKGRNIWKGGEALMVCKIIKESKEEYHNANAEVQRIAGSNTAARPC